MSAKRLRNGDTEPLAYIRERVIVDEQTGCWNWQKARNPKRGYGVFRYRGKARLTHRVAYAASRGLDERALPFICHSRDNPHCTNPGHLFAGTAQDNSDDAVSKGRMAHGSKHWRSRLCADDVREIRTRIRTGETHAAIAALFGVSSSVISEIGTHRAWRSE